MVLRHHVDRAARTLGHAQATALAVVVVELEALARPELDHRVVRTDAVAVVALEAVAAGQAAARFVQRIAFVQAALNFLEGRLPADDVEHAFELLVAEACQRLVEQQGELAGYEVREYLLEKWGRKCAYCDAAGVPLQIEHLHARSRGGSNRISNLALACGPCNHKKAALPLEVFLAKDPKRLAAILSQAKRPLKDAAAVNSTRWALANALKATGLPVELASGGRTKYNRSQLGVPKTHALDAACVGSVDAIQTWRRPTLQVKCTGRGSYQRTRLDKYGFPRGYLLRSKAVPDYVAVFVCRRTANLGMALTKARIAMPDLEAAL